MRLSFLLFFISFSAYATTLRLVTGEYRPYVGERLPAGGLSTQIVKAAFRATHQDVEIDFIPWNRAMNQLNLKSAAGSFPWAKNDERVKSFFYSIPLHDHRVLSFIKKGGNLDKNFNPVGAHVCQPSGWERVYLDTQILKYKMILTQPINMESCMRMLALGRIDIVIMNGVVGNYLLKEMYKDKSPIVGVDKEAFRRVGTLHFIISKQYPNGQKIMNEFNRGLSIIKKNGEYNKILNEHYEKETSRANCVSCNRLGLL